MTNWRSITERFDFAQRPKKNKTKKIKHNIMHHSQNEQQDLRLKICTACIYSACNGNQSNKCNVNEMTCTQDNNALVIGKASNAAETCPMSFWDITNSARTTHNHSSGGSSCGCGR